MRGHAHSESERERERERTEESAEERRRTYRRQKAVGAPYSQEDAALTRGWSALTDPDRDAAGSTCPTDRRSARPVSPVLHDLKIHLSHRPSPLDRLLSPCRRPPARSGPCSASRSPRRCGSGCCGAASQQEVRSHSPSFPSRPLCWRLSKLNDGSLSFRFSSLHKQLVFLGIPVLF